MQQISDRDLCPESPNLLTAALRWSWYHTSVQILIVQIQLYMWVSLCVSEWPLRYDIYSTLVVGTTKHVCSTGQLCWYMQNSSPLCELVVVEWIAHKRYSLYFYICKSNFAKHKCNSIRFDLSQLLFNFNLIINISIFYSFQFFYMLLVYIDFNMLLMVIKVKSLT